MTEDGRAGSVLNCEERACARARLEWSEAALACRLRYLGPPQNMEPTTANSAIEPEQSVVLPVEHGPTQRLAALVFAALVVACFAAFFVTQRLKHTPTIVEAFKMTPSFVPEARPTTWCRHPLARSQVLRGRQFEYISFRTSQAVRVDVIVVTAAGTEVATIVSDIATRRYRRLSICWNGHEGPQQQGGLAKPGQYGVEVRIRGAGRSVPAQRTFRLLA